jgi:hypothetical protein
MARIPRSVLAQLEDLLVSEIPRAVKAAKIAEPVYCLRIWYNGTDSPSDAVPWLMLVKESTRQQLFTERGAGAIETIWLADELTLPGQAFNVHLSEKRLENLYAKWYQYLCDVEDDEELQPFREMVQRVARKLNALRWQELALVTDDFVVFPADGSHTFWDDFGDMMAGISPEQLATLRSRNLIPAVAEDQDEDEG